MCCVDICVVHQSSEAVLARMDAASLGRKQCFLFPFWAAQDTPVLYHPANKWFAEQPVKAVGHLMQVLLGRAVCLCYLESARVLWAELWLLLLVESLPVGAGEVSGSSQPKPRIFCPFQTVHPLCSKEALLESSTALLRASLEHRAALTAGGLGGGNATCLIAARLLVTSTGILPSVWRKQKFVRVPRRS